MAAASNSWVVGGTGGCSSPAKGEPAMATGKTRCSGSHTESKPNWSASPAASAQIRGCMRPRVTANFTWAPPTQDVKLANRRLARRGSIQYTLNPIVLLKNPFPTDPGGAMALDTRRTTIAARRLTGRIGAELTGIDLRT